MSVERPEPGCALDEPRRPVGVARGDCLDHPGINGGGACESRGMARFNGSGGSGGTGLTQVGLDSLAAIYGMDVILVKGLVFAVFFTTYRARAREMEK